MKRYRLPLVAEVPIPSEVEAALPQPIAYYYLASDVDAYRNTTCDIIAANGRQFLRMYDRIAELEKALSSVLFEINSNSGLHSRYQDFDEACAIIQKALNG